MKIAGYDVPVPEFHFTNNVVRKAAGMVLITYVVLDILQNMATVDACPGAYKYINRDCWDQCKGDHDVIGHVIFYLCLGGKIAARGK